MSTYPLTANVVTNSSIAINRDAYVTISSPNVTAIYGIWSPISKSENKVFLGSSYYKNGRNGTFYDPTINVIKTTSSTYNEIYHNTLYTTAYNKQMELIQERSTSLYQLLINGNRRYIDEYETMTGSLYLTRSAVPGAAQNYYVRDLKTLEYSTFTNDGDAIWYPESGEPTWFISVYIPYETSNFNWQMATSQKSISMSYHMVVDISTGNMYQLRTTGTRTATYSIVTSSYRENNIE